MGEEFCPFGGIGGEFRVVVFKSVFEARRPGSMLFAEA
jgi:hypothetical protein